MSIFTERASHQLVVCPRCHGTGTITTPRTPEAHGVSITCTTCNGHRVVNQITTVTYKPVTE